MATEGDIRELNQEDWPEALTREVNRIRSWPAVDPASLSLTLGSTGRLHIEFTLQTDRLLEPAPNPIKDFEPVILVYRSVDAVGMHAPAVWSARPDFPRDIGHINPTPLDLNVSLCLARAGLQAIYDQYGVDGVLDRLTVWFHDAKTGQLMQDGWEPVPTGEGQDTRTGYFDIGYFQELATVAAESPGYCCGVARLFTEELGGSVVFLNEVLDLSDNSQVDTAKERIRERRKEKSVEYYIPWVFVWSDREQPIDRQIFGVWNCFGDIEDGLKGTGIDSKLPTAVVDAVLRLADPKTTDGRPVALMVGIWRPQPISDSVFGMASAREARRLEVRAYLLSCEKHVANPIDHSVPARQLVGHQLPTREMLAYASGIDTISPVALLGYGALGSCVAEFLLRAGISKIAVLDNDTLQPHNLARHTATAEDLYAKKVDHLNWAAGKVTFFDQEIQRDRIDLDILNVSGDFLTQLADAYPFIIDATADERVRRRLARAKLPSDATFMRIEILNGGRLGVLFMMGPSNFPNAIDLYYELCLHAVEDKAIEQWLREERAAGASSEELIMGMGCASATTRMPKYLVSQHASAFMPTIVETRTKPPAAGIGINPLAENGTPKGWHWFDYGGKVTVLEPSQAPGWEVRISPGASRRLEELRISHGDVETGGYLYGGYDHYLKQMYVVAVSDVPAGTTQSPTSINLGPAGRTRLELRLTRRAGGKIGRIGTWHSHPSSSPAMSARDNGTMETFLEEDRKNGVPTLLIITSPEGIAAHLWI